MLEIEFQTKYALWLKKNPPKRTEVYEYKVTNGRSFSLSNWLKKEPHQYRDLAIASTHILYHKISDQSSGNKPFDAFCAVGANALLVVYFNRYCKFCALPIEYVSMLIKKGKSFRLENIPDKYVFELLCKKKIINKKKKWNM